VTTSWQHSRHDLSHARLGDLRNEVVRLASLATSAITAASHALADADVEDANRVVADDDAVDAQRHAIEDECLVLLAGSGTNGRLDAHDVRFVGCTLRVVHELERTADLMVNVARSTARLYPSELDDAARRIILRLGRQCALQIRVAVNAFVDGDPSAADALADMDDTVDDLHDLLVRRALVRPHERIDDATVLRAVQLTLVARNYERAGDHAVTIADLVPFVVSGKRTRRRVVD